MVQKSLDSLAVAVCGRGLGAWVRELCHQVSLLLQSFVQTGPYILVGTVSYFLKDAVVICFFDFLVLPEFSKPEASLMKLYF